MLDIIDYLFLNSTPIDFWSLWITFRGPRQGNT